MPIADEALARRFELLFPHLDERQRRIYAAAEARSIGRGGITQVARVSGMARSTVQKAVAELDRGFEVSGRVRKPRG